MIQVKFNDKAKQVLADTLDLSGSVVVTELPQVGEEHTIYELHTTTPSIISYWIYVNGEWVNIDENLEFETQEKTVSPSTNTQKITPDEGYDGLSKVTVNAVTNDIDENIVSGNIKKDVAILGVTGTYDGEPVELQDKTVSPTTVSQEVEADVDYDGLGKVTVEAIELQDKTVSPTTTKQEVLADENYDGLSKVTIEAIELQNKEISPSTSSQSVIPDKGYDGLREVTVNAIALQDKTVTPDAVRQEITYDSNYNGLGKVIVEAVEPVELQDKTVTPTTEIQRVTADEGYDGLDTVIVEAIELQNKTIAPTTESQNVTADSGYGGLGTVIVNAVTSAIDQNIIAENIKKDVEILGVTGTYEETVELQDKTVTPTTNTQKIVADENYDGLGKVTISAVTNAIDKNIKAENIKKDVSILGVTGTYEGIEEIGKLNTITLPIESVTGGGVGIIPLSKVHFYLEEDKELDLVTIDSSDGDKECGYLVAPLLDNAKATYSLHIAFDNDVIFGGDCNLYNNPIFVAVEDDGPHINIESSSREYDLTIFVGTLRLFNGMLN